MDYRHRRNKLTSILLRGKLVFTGYNDGKTPIQLLPGVVF